MLAKLTNKMTVASLNDKNEGMINRIFNIRCRSPLTMDATTVTSMKRSRSLNSLVDIAEFRYDDSEWETSKSLVDDSGVQSSDGFVNLEKKIDTLNKMCLEQTRVLSELAQQARGSRACTLDDEQLMDVLGVLLERLLDQRDKNEGADGARSLLSAIEARPSLERQIGDALTNLLQGEELKQRIVASTSASIREQIRSLFSAEVSSLYVPVMERAHRQLLKHVTKLVAAAFTDLEESTACNAEVLRQTSEDLQAALQQHQSLLRETREGSDKLAGVVASTTEKVLERELTQWREDFSSVLLQAASDGDSGRVDSPSPEPSRASPDQANVSGHAALTAVDRIMITAEITKRIKDGDVNGGFRQALLALDLTLVMAACRAAPAPAPGALAQPVLLSLIQQLATDLVDDTQLKCSYIEWALGSLRPSAHAPRVAAELARHLSAFCAAYPHHAQAHRISRIVAIARSLQ